MSLTPYQSLYRLATPPPTEVRITHDTNHSRNSSGSSIWSNGSTPDSIKTSATTPTRSPIYKRGSQAAGPALLPRLRTQDQHFAAASKDSKSHRRALSSTCNPPGQPRPARPTVQRSTTTPPECISLISPTSAASPYSAGLDSAVDSAVSSGVSSAGITSATDSPINFTFDFIRRSQGHSRSVSTSSIDPATLGRYGYPYRATPAYIPSGHYSPSVIPGSSVYVAPEPRLHNNYYSSDVHDALRFVSQDDPHTTLEDYLTTPNPPVTQLVPATTRAFGRGEHSYFWWDIRNIAVWEDFTMEAIREVPDFPTLLSTPVRAAAHQQPTIEPKRLEPPTEAALREFCRDIYAAKVNAALWTAQGARHMAMRCEYARNDGPHFVSNYQNDYEKTIFGNGRGRVVGIVRSYEMWNTGMRTESPNSKVYYLKGLSHLHHCMREHQCRYGFIMTEIELVCVRAGTEDVPNFGSLELTPTIAMNTHDGLTACMALWYLHMLAKEEPLPRQCGWKLDVGPPAAQSRRKTLGERDDWIDKIKPGTSEQRTAKRERGWVFPLDPYDKKKEGPAGRNGRARTRR
ncbi:hypothetical protein MMC09_005968 [Bachmanniomyces sp. S44760]|nr:hypothetical protein [Bachmanniomyces sp. S44760]